MSEEKENETAPAREETGDGPALLTVSAVEKLIDDWFNDHIRNSPVSRHTPAASHMNDAITALKVRLRGLAG